MNKITTSLAALAISGMFVAACGDDTSTGGAGATSSTTAQGTTTHVTSTGVTTSTHASTTTTGATTSTGNNFPVPPTLGDQIDRMGRPAINTALDETFIHAATGTAVTDDQRKTAENTYNADKDPSGWAAAYVPTFAAQLAVIDSLDTSTTTDGCGNQPASCTDHSAGCYNTLAGALADDQLYVNTGTTNSCVTYLGVEAVALGLIPSLSDCGGRRPVDDVIKTSYSILAAGDLTFSVDDNISPPAGLHPTTFPYYADPH